MINIAEKRVAIDFAIVFTKETAKKTELFELQEKLFL